MFNFKIVYWPLRCIWFAVCTETDPNKKLICESKKSGYAVEIETKIEMWNLFYYQSGSNAATDTNTEKASLCNWSKITFTQLNRGEGTYSYGRIFNCSAFTVYFPISLCEKVWKHGWNLNSLPYSGVIMVNFFIICGTSFFHYKMMKLDSVPLWVAFSRN